MPPMFEQAFNTVDNAVRNEAGCQSELDYTEQNSWLLFLKYLEDLERDRADEAALSGKKYSVVIGKLCRWELVFVAFALPPVTRQTRADHAKAEVDGRLEDKQRAFVEFVLGQYVAQGVDELDLENLPALLRLKYRGAIADAITELG
jgi:hypothetical protein